MKRLLLFLFLTATAFAQPPQQPRNYPEPKPGDFTAQQFKFKTGEQMDVRIHYYTAGTPAKDASGKVTNAVLILHGTGGNGRSLLGPTFAGALFCPGCLLDGTKYFIVSPDNVGHGSSSKPSDGMKMSFPRYDYDDMVALQHALLTQGLGVKHLRLVIGTSMGCMHSWVWTENYPDFMDAAMPLACLPTEIAGRNRMWRKMLMDGIKADPAWNNGNYTQEPMEGLRLAETLLIVAGSAPLYNQKQAPTRDEADKLAEQRVDSALKTLDANDLIYQVDASRNYNPEPKLETVKVPVMAVNSADDFINPPELGILERLIKRVQKGRATVIPISDHTRGHGTHTIAEVWQNFLADLLQVSGGLAPGTNLPPAYEPAMSLFRASLSQLPDTSDLKPGEVITALPNYGFPVYKVGNGVTPPRAIYTPDPQYPPSAKKHKKQGTAVFAAIVGPNGLVRDTKLTRSSGNAELDQNAADVLRTWRFQPAAKDGQPVGAQINVEMNFRLY